MFQFYSSSRFWVNFTVPGVAPQQPYPAMRAPFEDPLGPATPAAARYPLQAPLGVYPGTQNPGYPQHRGSHYGQHHVNQNQQAQPGYSQHPGGQYGQHRVTDSQQTQPSRVPGYDVVKTLRHGGMSEAVNVVEERASGKVYVEKTVSFVAKRRERRVRAEVKALQLFKGHSNINAMETYLWQEGVSKCSIILEHCDQGSLHDCIKDHLKYGSEFAEDGIWHIMDSVAKALLFMHTGLTDYRTAIKGPRPDWDVHCHLDIKPSNIFLSSKGATENFPRVVLGDFGCVVSEKAMKAGKENPLKQSCGTPEWYPPEGLATDERGSSHYGPETDIWQLGATIHCACRLLKTPDRSLVNTRRVVGRQYGGKLRSIVLRCTESDYSRRLTAAEVLRITSPRPQSGA